MDFIIHLHRANMAAGKPDMWYFHLAGWGPAPRAFVKVVCTVPTWTFGGKDKSCGCANAWMAGTVDPKLVAYDATGWLFIGPRDAELEARLRAAG